MKLFTQISPWTTRTAQAGGPDDAYMKAVRSNDMATAQRMVDEAARNAGYRTMGYHVTSSPPFTVFDPERSFDAAFWFTTDPSRIERGETGASVSKDQRTVRTWLDTGKAAGWDEYDLSTPSGLADAGYDSAILDDDIAMFRRNRIKSAAPVTYDDAGNIIPLSERFDSSNPDIRY